VRAVIQRVTRASVTVDEEEAGRIEAGLLTYLGIGPSDSDDEVDWMTLKIATMRIFSDEQGRFDRSLEETGGGALVVSQFTLYGDTSRGRRPAFTSAAPPEIAEPLIDQLVESLRARGIEVATGRFGSHMLVDAVNDGPVTIMLDSADRDRLSRA
jgi:D-tyrosyl-tRNA(Tyr) deacylase